MNLLHKIDNLSRPWREFAQCGLVIFCVALLFAIYGYIFNPAILNSDGAVGKLGSLVLLLYFFILGLYIFYSVFIKFFAKKERARPSKAGTAIAITFGIIYLILLPTLFFLGAMSTDSGSSTLPFLICTFTPIVGIFSTIGVLNGKLRLEAMVIPVVFLIGFFIYLFLLRS